MGKFSFFSDAVLKISVNLWFIFNPVWFHLWALLLCYFTDNKRNPNIKRKRGQQNQTRCSIRMGVIEIIIACNLIIADRIAKLY